MKAAILLASAVFLVTTSMAEVPAVSYTLAMSRPSTHIFEVEMNVTGLDSADSTLDVALPVWRTGRYLVLDLANGVVKFGVVNEMRKALEWEKTDKTTWRIKTKGASSVSIRYEVFANEFDLRTRGLNDDRAFVDGTGVFLYAPKYRSLPLTLKVIPFGNWHVTTGLDSVAGSPNTFSAPNYDHLADCPLEIGTQKDFPFVVEGKQHVLSITGTGNYDADTLVRDISKIVRTMSAFWGGLPYERYIFFVALSSVGGGGTEHINSSVMGTRPFVFRNAGSYRGFLGLVSHEFFHTWNVKQLRPAGINTYDWTKENYAREFWVAEGTTSYYGGVLLARAGFMTPEQYVGRLASAIESDRGRPGNLNQSLSEASFDAWIGYWKRGQRTFNYETDYYGRGWVTSFVLDMTIRGKTKNRHSLDDVMRLLYRRFPLGKGGYTNADLQKACQDITGISFQEFFADYVSGTKPLPWDGALRVAGLERSDKEPVSKPWLGVMTRNDDGVPVVTQVVEGSPAYDAGLDVDDRILALNGYRVRDQELAQRISEMSKGDTVSVTVFRDDRLREFPVILEPPPFPPQRVSVLGKPTAAQRAVLESWLGQGHAMNTKP